jgi:hypothetical protein
MVIMRLHSRVIDITGAFVAEKITRDAWLNVDGVHYKLGTFLYGLKDAAREFYEKSSQHLVNMALLRVFGICVYLLSGILAQVLSMSSFMLTISCV